MSLNLVTAYKNVVKIVNNAYRKASKTIKNNMVENKELNDIVSAVDKFMENEIVTKLAQLYPSHGFIGEEFGRQGEKSAYEWLIDPIDGTINYVAGLPLVGTSVALRQNIGTESQTLLGVIFDWHNRDIYHAIKGKGAYKNKEKLQVSNTKQLKDSIVTFCLTSHYNAQHTKDVLTLVEKLSPRVRGLRLIVCSTIELTWLASGKTDGMCNVKPSRGLGSCAGKLIVTEAGGKVTNLQGEKQAEEDTLLITNGIIHDEILRVLK